MTTRTFLSRYSSPVSLSLSALKNLATAQVNYAYTGVMEIETGIIDLCAAAGTNPHYKTITPTHTVKFPQLVEFNEVAPIVHGGPGSGSTSHELLAGHVIRSTRRRSANELEHFCGFTIRLNDKPTAEFSGTSRTLNTGVGFSNGELEECLRTRIMHKISPVLALYGWTDFAWVPPRITPDAAQSARGGALAAPGLFAAISARRK